MNTILILAVLSQMQYPDLLFDMGNPIIIIPPAPPSPPPPPPPLPVSPIPVKVRFTWLMKVELERKINSMVKSSRGLTSDERFDIIRNSMVEFVREKFPDITLPLNELEIGYLENMIHRINDKKVTQIGGAPKSLHWIYNQHGQMVQVWGIRDPNNPAMVNFDLREQPPPHLNCAGGICNVR